MSFVTMKDGIVDGFFIRPLMQALKIGLTPIIHGDLVFDLIRGVSVISADQLAFKLGTAFRRARVLFGCDVDGVFTEDPRKSGSARIIPTVDRSNARQVLRQLKKGFSTDTTGGMYGKVLQALKLAKQGCPCFIFNLKRNGLLASSLAGKPSSGTSFPPWKMHH